MVNHIHQQSYREALDELAFYWLLTPKELFEARQISIDCLFDVKQHERPKYSRLAIGCLIVGNIRKAIHFIELGLSKCEKTTM